MTRSTAPLTDTVNAEEGQGLLGGEPPEMAVVEDFQFDWGELEVLARHYLWRVRDCEYQWMYFKMTDCSWFREKEYAEERVRVIERILGEDGFAKAVAPVEEKWRRQFDDLKVFLATPGKCEQCGEDFDREVAYMVTCERCHVS